MNIFPPGDLSRSFSPPGIPSALAPFHLPFFAGIVVAAAVLTISWRRYLSTGFARGLSYERKWSLIGIVLIILGTASDLLWPPPLSRTQVTGLLLYEALSVLLSPPHLVQAFGLALFVAAPLRNAWSKPLSRTPELRTQLPVVLSAALLLSLLTYLTQFAHPIVDPWAEIGFQRRGLQNYRLGSQFFFGESLGVLSTLLQTGLFMGLLLPMIKQHLLPGGSLTIIFTLNALGMSVLQGRYIFILGAAAAGIVADIFLKQLRLSRGAWEFRLFAFAIPVVYYVLYFLVLKYLRTIDGFFGPAPVFGLEGLGWSLHLWLGTTLAAGLVGWLLSYLVMPTTSEHSQ